VLLSYQKHHAPSSAVIPEGKEQKDEVYIVKPIYGIE